MGVPVDVIGPDETRIYYIPRFTKQPDALDEKKQNITLEKMVLEVFLFHPFQRKKSKIMGCFFVQEPFGKFSYMPLRKRKTKKSYPKSKIYRC